MVAVGVAVGGCEVVGVVVEVMGVVVNIIVVTTIEDGLCVVVAGAWVAVGIGCVVVGGD